MLQKIKPLLKHSSSLPFVPSIYNFITSPLAPPDKVINSQLETSADMWENGIKTWKGVKILGGSWCEYDDIIMNST